MKLPVLVLSCMLLGAAAARSQIQIPQGTSHETVLPDGGRFEIIQAQTAAKWTFRLDRYTGQVAILVQNSEGAYVWQVSKVVNPSEVPPASLKPRFQLFLSGLSAKFSFLLDTETGKAWSLVTLTDKAGKESDYVWQPFAGQ